MKILIVEPDTNRQRQLRTILSSLGHKSAEIESTLDSKGAISLLRKKRFDCSFISMAPGQFDALELLKNIRTGGSSRTLPVIIYSGEVTKENVVSAHEAGSNAFLAYPFSVSDVESVILKATTGKKS
ncbi:MAG: response regulator [Bdellovibrionales bacterium]|nr:response regulator [Bdellovibrionales bacterium]